MQCIQIKIQWDDYPNSAVCIKCYEKVLDFYEFQQMCYKSIEKLKNILKDETENVAEKCVVSLDVQSNRISLEELTEQVVLNPPKELPELLSEDTKFKKNGIKNEADIIDIGEELNAIHEDNTRKNTQECEAAVRNINDITMENYQTDEEGTSLSENSKSCEEKITNHEFLCEECPKTFKTQHSLEHHQRKHKGLPPYSCSYANCERHFDRWQYFQEHLKQHTSHSPPTYKCDAMNCGRVYKNKSALTVHQRKFHNIGPELKTHMCEKCGKVFKSSSVLNDHRFTHFDRSQLPFTCEEEGCSKKFSNKEKLKIHKLRHDGIKNFICPHCGMRKTTRNELKIHINYHTLERTWACSFCSKICNSAGNLKMHIRNIHERAKDFACSYCERTFAKADTRKYHEMTHTGEKPHACGECGRRFLQPAALRTHRKVHLKEKGKMQGLKTPTEDLETLKKVKNREEDNHESCKT